MSSGVLILRLINVLITSLSVIGSNNIEWGALEKLVLSAWVDVGTGLADFVTHTKWSIKVLARSTPECSVSFIIKSAKAPWA